MQKYWSSVLYNVEIYVVLPLDVKKWRKSSLSLEGLSKRSIKSSLIYIFLILCSIKFNVVRGKA